MNNKKKPKRMDFDTAHRMPKSFKRYINGEITKEEAIKERMEELGY